MMTTSISVKELRNLIQYSTDPIPTIENLIKHKNDSELIDLTYHNDHTASELYSRDLVNSRLYFITKDVPDVLRENLKIYKEIDNIVLQMSKTFENLKTNDVEDCYLEPIRDFFDEAIDEFSNRYPQAELIITDKFNHGSRFFGVCDEIKQKFIECYSNENVFLRMKSKISEHPYDYKFELLKWGRKSDFICMEESMITRENLEKIIQQYNSLENLYYF